MAAPKSLLWKAFLCLGRALPPEVILSWVMWCHGTFSEKHKLGAMLIHHYIIMMNPTQNTYKTSTERTSNANAAGNKGKTAGAAKNTPNHTPLDSYKPAGSPCARFNELAQRFPPSPAHITSFVGA